MTQTAYLWKNKLLPRRKYAVGIDIGVNCSKPSNPITALAEISRITGASNEPINEEFETKIVLFGHSLDY
mgnify:FL=1